MSLGHLLVIPMRVLRALDHLGDSPGGEVGVLRGGGYAEVEKLVGGVLNVHKLVLTSPALRRTLLENAVGVFIAASTTYPITISHRPREKRKRRKTHGRL